MRLLQAHKGIFLGLLMFLLFVPFKVGAAGDACTCFCGDSTNGATELSTFASTTECATACEKKNDMFVGCYTDEKSFPLENDQCWTEAECKGYSIDQGNGVAATGIWAGVNPICSKTKSGYAMGFCYSPERKATLNIPILGVQQVGSIGEYVTLAYKFLLPAMALVAVVMLMVGGLEYVVSTGSEKRVSKAKERMKNAIVGLILLLFAYTLANLIDPRLIHFSQLRVPMMKRAVILDPNSSCERLNDYGFVISTSGDKTCGNEGKITKVPTSSDLQNSNWEVGDTCKYISCGKDGFACVQTGSGSYCSTCSLSTTVSGFTGYAVTPSQSACNAIGVEADAEDQNDEHKYSCFFDDGYAVDECVEVVTYGDLYINCTALKSDAKPLIDEGWDPCGFYEKLTFHQASTSATGARTTHGAAFANICNNDVCGLAAMGGKSGCTAALGTSVGGVMLTSNSCASK